MDMVLQKVKVSKGDAGEFEKLIQQRIRSWNEKTTWKKRIGIELENYDEFLESFQRSTGIDKETLESLKDIKYCNHSDELIKSFSIKNTGTSGAFGLIALSKCDNKIDLAYAVYSVAVEFKPVTRLKANLFVFFGIPQLCLEEEEVFEDFDFTSVDLEKLQENYIKAKALKSFANEGIVKKINYVKSIEDTNWQYIFKT